MSISLQSDWFLSFELYRILIVVLLHNHILKMTNRMASAVPPSNTTENVSSITMYNLGFWQGRKRFYSVNPIDNEPKYPSVQSLPAIRLWYDLITVLVWLCVYDVKCWSLPVPRCPYTFPLNSQILTLPSEISWFPLPELPCQSSHLHLIPSLVSSIA